MSQPKLRKVVTDEPTAPDVRQTLNEEIVRMLTATQALGAQIDTNAVRNGAMLSAIASVLIGQGLVTPEAFDEAVLGNMVATLRQVLHQIEQARLQAGRPQLVMPPSGLVIAKH